MDGASRAGTLALVLMLAAVPSLPVAADGHVVLQVYETVHGDDRSFGEAVAWHGDSLVVGAPRDNLVRVLRLQEGVWREVQTLDGAGDRSYEEFGSAVSVHGDLLVVGAPGEYDPDHGYGVAHVYRHSGGHWTHLARLVPDDEAYDFGFSVDAHGDWVAVGAPNAVIGGSTIVPQPSVHLFKVGATVQHAQTIRMDTLVDQRWFGHDLDLHGDRLIVGAPGSIGEERIEDGGAYVYVRSGNTWSREATFQMGALEDAGGFGGAVALSDDEAVVCDDHSIYVTDDDRSMHVYRRSGATWSLAQTLHEVSCDQIALDGDRLVTVGSWSPYVRVYGPSGTRWSQQEADVDGRPTAVAIGEPAVALGHPGSSAGHVRLLGRNVGPTAAVAPLEPPRDLDGDGVETVALDGSASDGGDGDAVHHAWYDVEDRLLGTGPRLALELPVGTHPVRLAVWDDALGTDVAETVVQVLPPPPPAADFSWLPAAATVDEALRFVDESTSEYGHVVAWSWDLDGDGGVDATGPAPSWTFDRSGGHDVTLTVRTDIGTEASATKRVTVQNLAPEARAGMDQILRDDDGDGTETVELDGGGSRDRDGEVRKHEWTRDGRRLASGETATLRLGHGVHDIDLTVTDDQGSKDTDRVTVLVLKDERNATAGGDRPDAAFSWQPTAGPPAHAAAFKDASSDADGRVVMWWYDVGADGSYEATEPDPVLAMGGYGATDVQLTVTDDDGHQSTSKRNVFLKNEAPTAVADARATTAYVGQVVVFTDNSTDPEGALVERAWDLGDGTTSTQQAPAHVYEAAGTYTVTLTVTDDGGKSDAASLEVTVRDVPDGVTVPAVAGSPVVEQAHDSPFFEEATDADGDGTPDAADRDDDADAVRDGFQATAEDRDGPLAALDPAGPWLWLGAVAVLALLAAVLWAARR